jgi:lipopolysaccharide/colanic/teichoic acid biosynthesis glycosyltransferase
VSRAVKRLMDMAIAAPALFVLAPVMLGVALAIRIRLGSPVLFRQVRPGFRARAFELTKFRTLLDEVDANGRILTVNERMTPLGHLLRRTSLDELPQLWNILKGDMSLVGPRPLLMEYLPHYSPEQARRHDVRPGLTGWAQVHGRALLGFDERFKLDVWYVDNWSLLLDIKILAKTAIRVVRGEGVPPPTHEYYEFTGTASAVTPDEGAP